MLTSFRWLQELCPIETDVHELAHRITQAGLEVEGIEEKGPANPVERLPIPDLHRADQDRSPPHDGGLADLLHVVQLTLGPGVPAPHEDAALNFDEDLLPRPGPVHKPAPCGVEAVLGHRPIKEVGLVELDV